MTPSSPDPTPDARATVRAGRRSRLRRRLPVVGLCAATVLISVAGSATASRMITSRDIADGSIHNRDIAEGTIWFNRLTLGAQGKLKGQEGPAGRAGPVGPAGLDGEDGADGAPGADGEDGAPGADGVQGPIGPEGPVGPQGPEGETGEAGQDGTTGSDGAPGVPGSVGPEGPQGPQGPQGPEGPAGPAGGVTSVVMRDALLTLDGGAAQQLIAACNAGEQLVGGSVNVIPDGSGQVLVSRPATAGSSSSPSNGTSPARWLGLASGPAGTLMVVHAYCIS